MGLLLTRPDPVACCQFLLEGLNDIYNLHYEAFSFVGYVLMYDGVSFQYQLLCISIVLTSCSHEGVALNNGHIAL